MTARCNEVLLHMYVIIVPDAIHCRDFDYYFHVQKKKDYHLSKSNAFGDCLLVVFQPLPLGKVLNKGNRPPHYQVIRHGE